jgi:hypothetical protein
MPYRDGLKRGSASKRQSDLSLVSNTERDGGHLNREQDELATLSNCRGHLIAGIQVIPA